jgi:hypothetical protein
MPKNLTIFEFCIIYEVYNLVNNINKMTKRKVNVVSNELDQAPKNRAAGYGKVVNSMRKEISEAMDRIFLK